MGAKRHKSRTLALQALYEQETSGHPARTVLARLLVEKPLEEEFAAYAGLVVDGVTENAGVLDEQIRRYAPAWPLEQLPVIDKNILRLAIFEILFNNEVPVKVAINEAVELAKTFGGETSPRFVNGVLGSVSTEARR